MVSFTNIKAKILLLIFCVNLLLLGLFLGNLELIASLITHPIVNKPFAGHFNLSNLKTYYQLKYSFHEITGLETPLAQVKMQETCYYLMRDDLTPDERNDPFIKEFLQFLKPKPDWFFVTRMGATIILFTGIIYVFCKQWVMGFDILPRVWKVAEAWCGHNLDDIYSVTLTMKDAFGTAMFHQQVHMARFEYICMYYGLLNDNFSMMDLKDYITTMPWPAPITPLEHSLKPYPGHVEFPPIRWNEWGPPPPIEIND